MKLIYWIRALFRGLPQRRSQERGMRAELDSYLELAVEDKCRGGMTP